MIIKRITASLRRQDWTMVFIEFVLVVVGVLLAFQINDWSANRAAASDRREATERLLDESERNIAEVKEANNFIDGLIRDLHFTLERLEAGQWSKADEERMTKGLLVGRYMAAMVPTTSVYEDIVASGSLDKIGNPEVRSAISNFHATLAFDERSRQQFLPILLHYEAIPEFRYRAGSSAEDPPKLTVDFPALAGNRESLRTIAITLSHHFGLRWDRRNALQDAIEMCRSVAQALKRKCNEDRPLPVYN